MQKKPIPPEYPKWLTTILWIFLVVICSANYIFNIEINREPLEYSLLALPFILSFFFADRSYKRDLKKYEILDLSWKISNVEGWIHYHEKDLKDGQPWFDEENPCDWEFEKKYSIRQSEEKLIGLKEQLEMKTKK